MKTIKFVLIALLISGGFHYSFAQTSSGMMNGPFLQPDFQDNRIEITADQLPEPVLKTLRSDNYKDWAIAKAFKVTSSSEKVMNQVHYEVLLKLNEKESTLKLDKDGNFIE